MNSSKTDAIKKTLLYLSVFIAFSLAIYWPSLFGGPFWDDWVYIFRAYRNQMSAPSPLIFFPGGSESKSWPVFFTLLWGMFKIFKHNYLYYHLTNIVFHGINGFLVWKILKKIHIGNAFLWALLFVVHPLHLFTVAWIIQSKTIFSITFFLCSIWFYIKFYQRQKIVDQILMFFFFGLSLLTKSATAGFALVLIFSFLLFRKKMSWKKYAVMFVAPLLILSVLAVFRTAWSYNVRDFFREDRTLISTTVTPNQFLKRVEVSNIEDLEDRFLITAKIFGRYSAFIFLPVGGDHVFQEATTLDYSSLEFAIILSVLTSLILLCRYFYRRKLYIELLGFLFFCVSILPLCGAFYLSIFSTTNFNPYWLSIPFLGLLPAGSHFFKSKNDIIIVIALFTGITHWQAYQFINTEELFLDSIKKSPDQIIYQATLIDHYVKTGQCKKAKELFDKYSKTGSSNLFRLDEKVLRCEELREGQE